jgi:hypothetical protein
LTPEELKAFQAQKAAEKARKTAELEARLAQKAAKRAEKAALLAADPIANGLPTTANFEGQTITIDYAKSFNLKHNLKHFNPDRGGLAGATTNTVIKDASQVRFQAPVNGVVGTGSNVQAVLVFTSDAPVDLEVFAKNAAGVFEKVDDLHEPLTISGIVQEGSTDKVLITHFEASIVGDAIGVVTSVTDDLGDDGSAAALAAGDSAPVAIV